MLEKLQAKLRETRENNKGFTLIELLIVIAIIAILAAVLAPQYIQYLERSRESNDVQVAAAIADAAAIAATDPANGTPETITITWATNSSSGAIGVTQTTAYATAVEADIQAVMGTAAAPDSTAARTASSEADGVGDFTLSTNPSGEVILTSAKWNTQLGMNLDTSFN